MAPNRESDMGHGDIEYPRLGFIRVDAFDRALTELRESMK